LDEKYPRRSHEASDAELKKKRIVVMEIILSKDSNHMDTSGIGYQELIPEDQVQEKTLT